ncbi:hypothetical protein QEG98_35615 [Myxococcus sp. MxC21-1]|uniref:hypothetical protein n=1 Tax=Myxococcus sp. MxC21-1 TaxID=3041439 RepID=UPI0029317CBE|nr:hypothetical protein [Myxococcus sp. MxC21-1]WNZ61184.1 hypothetical protein QEG98_35615 [Myxococcus sp. MxC21-1]
MMMRMKRYGAGLLTAWLLAVAPACGDSDEGAPPDAGLPDAGDSGVPDAGDSGTPDAGEELPPLLVPAGCNPLASEHDCLLPYPSDYFLEEDAALPSGHRVRLSEAAKLKAPDGAAFDFTDLHPADGYSHGTQVLALFPDGVDDARLPSVTSPTAATNGNTVFLDAERGEGVLHFAELDPRAPDDARRALLLRPVVRLRNTARYIIALRGLTAKDGTPVPVPEGFRRIRDGQTAGDPLLAPLAAGTKRTSSRRSRPRVFHARSSSSRGTSPPSRKRASRRTCSRCAAGDGGAGGHAPRRHGDGRAR